jgi:tRNA-specific 2-thiouridylase
VLHAGARAIEVEFAGGEEGVAPGQACVLYDSGAPEARLLGGGVIRAAVGTTRPAPEAARIPLPTSA